MTLRPIALAAAACCITLASAQDEPAPDPGQLTIIVVNEDGEGLFKARAHLVLTDDEKAAIRKETGRSAFIIDSVSSDPDGFLTIDVPARQARQVAVSKRQLTNRVIVEVEPMEPGEEREVEVSLKTRPDLDITGTLVRAEDGKPLAGAEVWREPATHTSPREPLTLPRNRAPDAITGEDGAFRLRIKSWTGEAITLTCDGRGPKVIVFNPRRDEVDLDEPVALGPAARLRGAVEAADGRSLAGAEVHLALRGREIDAYPLPEDTFYSGTPEYSFVAAIDEDGAFAFDQLPPGAPLALTVVQQGEVILDELEPRTLPTGTTSGALLRVLPDAEVTGVVTEEDGAAAGGVDIWLLRANSSWGGPGFFQRYEEPTLTTVTQPDGTFRFDSVPAGLWKIGLAPHARRSILPEAERWAPQYEQIEVAGEPVDKAFQLARGLYITGRVLLPTGEPRMGNVGVNASLDGRFLSGSCSANGEFKLGPAGPGHWWVSAYLKSSDTATGDHLLARPQPVSVLAGGEPVDLRLRVGATLQISAIDSESQEAVPVGYFLWQDGKTALGRPSARPEVSMAHVPPGRYTISLLAADGRVAARPIELEPRQELVVEPLELQPGGFVEVHYMGAAENGQLVLEVDGVSYDSTTLRTGTTETLQGAVGKALLRVYRPDGGPIDQKLVASYPVEITAGETAKLTVGTRNESEDD